LLHDPPFRKALTPFALFLRALLLEDPRPSRLSCVFDLGSLGAPAAGVGSAIWYWHFLHGFPLLHLILIPLTLCCVIFDRFGDPVLCSQPRFPTSPWRNCSPYPFGISFAGNSRGPEVAVLLVCALFLLRFLVDNLHCRCLLCFHSTGPV